MKRLLLLIFALLPLCASAQCYVYAGRSTYSSDIICTYDGKYLYAGRSTYSSDIVCTFDGRSLCEGRSTYSSDIVCTIGGSIPILVLIAILQY